MNMEYLQQSFQVHFEYKVFFTEQLFDISNPLFRDYLTSQQTDNRKKLLFVLDQGVVDHHPGLPQKIKNVSSSWMAIKMFKIIPITKKEFTRTSMIGVAIFFR